VPACSQTDFVQSFEADVKQDKLPQVSWLIGPARQSEHANNHPADGEDLSARIMKILAAHQRVYNKTVFILNYDEGGQFFDHPAIGASPCACTARAPPRWHRKQH
jgi:phospholipase C